MSVDWKYENERRISEKTQEIRLYCDQKKSSMTPRAFDLARLSFMQLLDNIADRDRFASDIVESIRRGMDFQEDFIALITEKQAGVLARGIVYNYIGDDLNLYPVTAEKKLLRAKSRNMTVCDIPIEEMTVRDIIYVASAITEGENFSKPTMLAVFKWFQNIGLSPVQSRVFSVLFRIGKPTPLRSIPQYSIFAAEYREAAIALIGKGYICELPGGLFCVTETVIE